MWPSNWFRKTANSSRTAAGRQELLIICHSGDPYGLSTMENICRGLEFAKIGFSVFDLQQNDRLPPLSRFDAIVTCTEFLSAIGSQSAKRMEKYVRDGGGLVVAYRGFHENLCPLLGADGGCFEREMQMTSGLSFVSELFPDTTGIAIGSSEWDFDHSRFDIDVSELISGCECLVSDSEGRPVCWTLPCGKGRVVFWNTSVLFSRALRGFAIQSILSVMSVGVAAIGGFAMFHIDDYPTSLSDAVQEPIATEYPGMNRNDFFFGQWYEDMMVLRAKHGLKYTWYTVMNYHDVDTAPGASLSTIETTTGQKLLSDRFQCARIIPDDDEFGFHGYNHQPLVATGWPDLETLKYKLEIARDLWESKVPAPLPVSWVPANNIYHPGQVGILAEVFPEITTVCSLYSVGDEDTGECREFGPEPWEPSLTCIPRETWSYVRYPKVRMLQLSQIASMGLWTHFLHPDDVYDIPDSSSPEDGYRNKTNLFWKDRNADGQPGMYHQLDSWIEQVRDLFPWLDFVTTSEAAARYHEHVRRQTDIRVSDSRAEITCETDGLYYLRTRSGLVVDSSNSDAVIVDSRPVTNGTLTVVRCEAGTAVLHFNTT